MMDVLVVWVGGWVEEGNPWFRSRGGDMPSLYSKIQTGLMIFCFKARSYICMSC
jgi:hypothetical protein